MHDDGPYRIYPLPVPRYDLGDRPLASPHETATPGGGNLVLRTTLFDRVGDFSTAYGPVGRGLGGAEDHEWVLRAIAAGARVQYVPDIVQYHYVDPTRLKLDYLMRKAYERSASAVRLGGHGQWQAPGSRLHDPQGGRVFARGADVEWTATATIPAGATGGFAWRDQGPHPRAHRRVHGEAFLKPLLPGCATSVSAILDAELAQPS